MSLFYSGSADLMFMHREGHPVILTYSLVDSVCSDRSTRWASAGKHEAGRAPSPPESQPAVCMVLYWLLHVSAPLSTQKTLWSQVSDLTKPLDAVCLLGWNRKAQRYPNFCWSVLQKDKFHWVVFSGTHQTCWPSVMSPGVGVIAAPINVTAQFKEPLLVPGKVMISFWETDKIGDQSSSQGVSFHMEQHESRISVVGLISRPWLTQSCVYICNVVFVN